ncbi:MAG: phosphoribosylformylglycinamidine synthase subunit PurQ, partial [Plesiomonas sp.]
IMNIAGADIGSFKRIKLSANWMSAAGHPGEDAGLYEAVKAVGEELCPELNLTIPVGKDSMSMKTAWQQEGTNKTVTSPMSLIITAFGVVQDIRKTVTPELRRDKGDTSLLLVDLGNGQHRLGGSCLAQVFGELGDVAPDLDNAALLRGFFETMQDLVAKQSVIAYHDRSDGGLFTTLVEMAFAGNTGLAIDIEDLQGTDLERLFNEELGAVLQVSLDNAAKIAAQFAMAGVPCHVIGTLADDQRITICDGGREIFSDTRIALRTLWSETTYRMQALRDNPACALEEFKLKQDETDLGLTVDLRFDPSVDVAAPYILKGAAPKMAILREQGVNSHVEMAAAFDRAGFESRDVHMSD